MTRTASGKKLKVQQWRNGLCPAMHPEAIYAFDIVTSQSQAS